MRHTGVDGLRGLASLVVLNFHILNQVSDGTLDDSGTLGEVVQFLAATPAGVFFAGPMAVHFFFLLSGFALFTGYRGGANSAVRFYLSRIARLYIPVWPALGLAILVSTLDSRNPRLVSIDSIISEPFGILKSATLILGVGIALQALWSLTWEVWFSFAVPAIDRLFRWNVNFWVSFALLSATMILGDLFNIGVLRYGAMFLVGALVSVHREKFSRWFSRLRKSTADRFVLGAYVPSTLLMLPWMLAAWFPSIPQTEDLLTFFYPLEFLAFLLMLGVALTARSSGRAFLDRDWVQHAGTISFSLYLTHQPILGLMARVDVSPIAVVALDLLFAITFAVLYFKLVEQPSHVFARALLRNQWNLRKP